MIVEKWKCKNCNHLNEVSQAERKKANVQFGALNSALVIVSGGMWFLIILIKDLMLFSFDAEITNVTPNSGTGKQKKNCKVCGSER